MATEFCRDWDTFYIARISFYSVFPNALPSSLTKLHAPGSSESFEHRLAQSEDFLNEVCEGLKQKYAVLPILHLFYMKE